MEEVIDIFFYQDDGILLYIILLYFFDKVSLYLNLQILIEDFKFGDLKKYVILLDFCLLDFGLFKLGLLELEKMIMFLQSNVIVGLNISLIFNMVVYVLVYIDEDYELYLCGFIDVLQDFYD